MAEKLLAAAAILLTVVCEILDMAIKSVYDWYEEKRRI